MAFEKEIDRINYMKGLIRVAKCNGVVELSEKQYINLIAQRLNLDMDIEGLLSGKEAICLSFSNRYEALLFLQESMQLCVVDGSFDDVEQNELISISEEIGLGREAYNKLYDWIKAGLEWQSQGKELIAQLAEGGQ